MNAAKTSHIAEKIREDLGGVKVIEVVLIEKAWQNDFQAYDNMIVGASTWFDGELPTYWDELVPELESLDLKGKKVAGPKGTILHELLVSYLNNAGMTEDDIEFMAMGIRMPGSFGRWKCRRGSSCRSDCLQYGKRRILYSDRRRRSYRGNHRYCNQ